MVILLQQWRSISEPPGGADCHEVKTTRTSNLARNKNGIQSVVGRSSTAAISRPRKEGAGIA